MLLEINYAFLNLEGILLGELDLKILAENDSLFCFSLPTVKKEKVAINNSSHLMIFLFLIVIAGCKNGRGLVISCLNEFRH